MSRQPSESLKAMALVLFVAAPMAYIVQISMGIPLSFFYTLLFAAVSICILEVIAYNRITAIAIPAAIIALCAFAWWVMDKDHRQFYIDYYWWAVDFLYNWSQYLVGNAIVLTAITTFLVTLFLWLFGRKFLFFPAVFVFVVAIVVIKWLNGLDTVLVPGMFASGGLILLWAKSFQHKSAKKAGTALPENGIALFLAPIALLIVLLSLVAVPPETARDWQSQQVYNLFERINNYLADYTGFNHPRNSFSIASYGFMPLGDRLGGPVTLSDQEVLHVASPGQMLLRGVIYNNYTGHSWTDTTDSQRIRFNSVNKATQSNTFDQIRPVLTGSRAVEFKQFIEPVTLSIAPVVNSASTLFGPFRGVNSISSDKFLAVLPFFNAKGEVFSSSDVHAGYSYKVKADYLHYDATGFDELMNSLMNMNLTDTTEQTQYIRQNYLALPENIEQPVYEVMKGIIGTNGVVQTSKITQDGNTSTKTIKIVSAPANDWQKALAIQDYLKKNFKYTLSPGVPTKGADFVSFFIGHEREGYCTYFASAMAVMARIAGIPSRYVEGYKMPGKNAQDPEYVITGEDAHAWAELYFQGIGWIPFDATPSGDTPSNEPSGDTGIMNPLPTPTHPDNGDTGDTGLDLPEKGLTWADIVPYLWVLPVAFAALVLLWVFSRMIWTRVRATPGHISRQFKEKNRRCAWYYGEILKLLEYYNYPVKKGETPYAYAARIDRWLRLEAGTFTEVANLISMLSYSDYTATDQDFNFMARFRRSLADYTYHTVGPWYYLWHQVLGFRQRASRPQSR